MILFLANLKYNYIYYNFLIISELEKCCRVEVMVQKLSTLPLKTALFLEYLFRIEHFILLTVFNILMFHCQSMD